MGNDNKRKRKSAANIIPRLTHKKSIFGKKIVSIPKGLNFDPTARVDKFD